MKYGQLVGFMWIAAALVAASAFAQQTDSRTCCGPGMTPGWKLMSQTERTQHREKMLSLKSYDECKSYVEEHHKQMLERAKEKGVSIQEPRGHPCDRMKARGQLN